MFNEKMLRVLLLSHFAVAPAVFENYFKSNQTLNLYSRVTTSLAGLVRKVSHLPEN